MADLWGTFQNIAQAFDPQTHDQSRQAHLLESMQLQHLAVQLHDHEPEICQLQEKLYEMQRELDWESQHADKAERGAHLGVVWGIFKGRTQAQAHSQWSPQQFNIQLSPITGTRLPLSYFIISLYPLCAFRSTQVFPSNLMH